MHNCQICIFVDLCLKNDLTFLRTTVEVFQVYVVVVVVFWNVFTVR